MSIDRINNKLLYINSYNRNKINSVSKMEMVKNRDTVEISSAGKNILGYSKSSNIDNSVKVEELRDRIQNGTYNVSARLTAKSILDNIDKNRMKEND